MDPIWYGAEKAARITGVTAKTLRRYQRQGLVRVRKDKGKNLYLIRDLLELRNMLDDPEGFCVGRLRTPVVLGRIQQLEREVATLRLALQPEVPPFDLDLASAEALYLGCVEVLSQKNRSVLDIKRWADVFVGLRCDHFVLMERVGRDMLPWSVFIRLADTMLEELLAAKEFVSSLHLQMLHDQLLQARKVLREEAVLFESANMRVVPELTPPPEPRAEMLESIASGK